LDGSNAKTLALPFEPWLVQDPVSFSPDSKWIYLCTTQPGKMGIWKVPADGNGEPVLLRAGAYLAAAISPDGHFMKVGMYDEGTRQLSDVIISFDNSEGPKTLPIAPGKPLLVQWTPDGKGVSYIAEENGLSNIYYLPWPRGKYKRLTSFDNDTIFNYAWASPDRIILSRGTESSDIVLLTNLRHK
jgi:Tol biopolymer transport system component